MHLRQKIHPLFTWIFLIISAVWTGYLYQLVDRFSDYSQELIAPLPVVSIGSVPLTIHNTNSAMSTAILKTSLGDITLELFPDKAPKTVENFLTLARSDFYDQTKFHRVIPDFMIQAGDPNTRGDEVSTYGTGGPDYVFEDEIHNVPITRGILAMANRGPNTNGSQFFVVTAEATPWLDGLHTVFGKVVEGMDVVDRISHVKTTGPDRPIEPVVLMDVIIEG